MSREAISPRYQYRSDRDRAEGAGRALFIYLTGAKGLTGHMIRLARHWGPVVFGLIVCASMTCDESPVACYGVRSVIGKIASRQCLDQSIWQNFMVEVGC